VEGQLAVLGPLQEHRFDAGIGEGVNLILHGRSNIRIMLAYISQEFRVKL
jgi:hypothetical protein